MERSDVKVEKEVMEYIAEARSFLPGLPEDMSFVWDINLIIPGNGSGGTLLEPTILGIGYDPDFKDKNLLTKNLRATILHECFHSVQGWSDKNSTLIPETLLEDGVLEGAATVFERDKGGTSPLWSMYEGDKTMQKWLKEILDQKYNPNSDQYNVYKFGEINGTKWMLYKLGTWIIDKVLARNSNLRIEDLANKNPKELLVLAGV